MFYIISYDIPNDKTRQKIAKILLDFGSRVQYSVFEAILTKELLEKLVKRLEKVINVEEDSIRVYRLCAECKKAIKILGCGKVSEDKDVYIL